MATKKEQQKTKRDKMLALIKAHPGITSAEIAEHFDMKDSSAVSTAMWPAIRSGRVMVERVNRNGRSTNAHYLPDQVPPDAVERINQKLVDAKDVIPVAKSPGARNSVFDISPRRSSSKVKDVQKAVARPEAPTKDPVAAAPRVSDRGFACAVASDGSLLLLRQGQIQFALSESETVALQTYLVKRAAASLFSGLA